MKILFINGSPNQNGNTAALASALLKGKKYETLNLTDYRIGSYGQKFEDDQFDAVIAKMKAADMIVIGSPAKFLPVTVPLESATQKIRGVIK